MVGARSPGDRATQDANAERALALPPWIQQRFWDLEVLIHIHTVMENSDYNNSGFSTGSVKDNMAALTELFILGLYFTCIATYFRLASKQLEGIIKLLEVFIALTLSPSFGGKTTNIDNVFSGGSG
jgi:hypothetical protein